MPELPEAETIIRGLKEIIPCHKINKAIVREEKIIAFPEKERFIKTVTGEEIKDITRRGKYILIKLSNNKTMVVHLRMTGRLLLRARTLPYDKHTHVIFELDNNLDLRFHNVRKFGRIYLVTDNRWEEAGGLATLGPEPLSGEFTLEKFKKLLEGRKANIKSLLLNQSFLAGLGNIYTDEALFRANISPLRKADSLNHREIEKLYTSIREVLKMGIKYGGTSFRDYRNAEGKKGDFQKHLNVYQREGKECPTCRKNIVREKIAGRSSYYCPNCQH